MTDLTLCSNIENSVENFEKESVPNQTHLSTKIGTRPTAIPRLSTATSQRSSHNTNSNGKNTKSKIPFSPLNIKSPRPKSVGSYIKSPMQEPEYCRDFLTSPTYTKRSSRDTNILQNTLNVDVRLRSNAKSLNRHDRAISEENSGRKTSMESSLSEKTNNSGNTNNNANYVIASRIGSLANAKHKPGGGNVRIFEQKLDFGNIESKCGSKKNIKHKPGGGVVEIYNAKMDFTKKAQSKINSLKNIDHQPSGGDVKIDNLKLDWNVSSKVGSMANIKHKPTGGNVQIVSESLPWLKYNKPNLPPEEIAKINKRPVREDWKDNSHTTSRSCSNSFCSDRSN